MMIESFNTIIALFTMRCPYRSDDEAGFTELEFHEEPPDLNGSMFLE
jgi:hypothetical protein